MGHIGVKGLRDATTGLDWDETDSQLCRICALANIKRLPFPKVSYTRAERPLVRVHTDICGKLPRGYGGYFYFILFIDDYSRWIGIWFLKQKSDALSAFKEYKAAVEKFHGLQITFLRIDNAPDLVEGQFRDYCSDAGITYEKAVPDAHQQNGVAERQNWTVASMTRAMLLDADLSDYFWPLAALSAVHIKNRVPHKALPPKKTPFEVWFGTKPDLSHLRPFGSKVTSRKLNSDKLQKFTARGQSGRFVGYARDSRGYLVWFPDSRTVLVRRDLIFHGMPSAATPNTSPITLPMWKDVPADGTSQFGTAPYDVSPLGVLPNPMSTETVPPECVAHISLKSVCC